MLYVGYKIIVYSFQFVDYDWNLVGDRSFLGWCKLVADKRYCPRLRAYISREGLIVLNPSDLRSVWSRPKAKVFSIMLWVTSQMNFLIHLFTGVAACRVPNNKSTIQSRLFTTIPCETWHSISSDLENVQLVLTKLL